MTTAEQLRAALLAGTLSGGERVSVILELAEWQRTTSDRRVPHPVVRGLPELKRGRIARQLVSGLDATPVGLTMGDVSYATAAILRGPLCGPLEMVGLDGRARPLPAQHIAYRARRDGEPYRPDPRERFGPPEGA